MITPSFILINIAIFTCMYFYYKSKYKFWATQPVFHYYNLYYWLLYSGTILKALPPKNEFYEGDIELLDFGYCHDPLYYNMKILPNHTKDWISNKLANARSIDIGEWQYATDKSCRTNLDHFEKMTAFMNSEDHSDKWPALNQYIKTIDRMRGTDFKKDFKELQDIWSTHAV